MGVAVNKNIYKNILVLPPKKCSYKKWVYSIKTVRTILQPEHSHPPKLSVLKGGGGQDTIK